MIEFIPIVNLILTIKLVMTIEYFLSPFQWQFRIYLKDTNHHKSYSINPIWKTNHYYFYQLDSL